MRFLQRPCGAGLMTDDWKYTPTANKTRNIIAIRSNEADDNHECWLA